MWSVGRPSAAAHYQYQLHKSWPVSAPLTTGGPLAPGQLRSTPPAPWMAAVIGTSHRLLSGHFEPNCCIAFLRWTPTRRSFFIAPCHLQLNRPLNFLKLMKRKFKLAAPGHVVCDLVDAHRSCRRWRPVDQLRYYPGIIVRSVTWNLGLLNTFCPIKWHPSDIWWCNLIISDESWTCGRIPSMISVSSKRFRQNVLVYSRKPPKSISSTIWQF